MVKRVLKIYIAGPMTGYPDYNRAAFNAKASELMAEGHIVLNPAVLPGGLCQSEYMDICLAMVRSADAIYLLKGWDVSAGARAEHALAEIRAAARNEGINYTASRLAAAFNHGFINKSLREVFDVTRMILSAKEELANEPHPIDGLSGEYAEKSLEEWAEQIRKGSSQ